MTGIVVQWYAPLPPFKLLCGGGIFLMAVVAYRALPLRRKFQYGFLSGLALSGLMAVVGGGLVHHHGVRNGAYWGGQDDELGAPLLVTLQEDLVE